MHPVEPHDEGIRSLRLVMTLACSCWLLYSAYKEDTPCIYIQMVTAQVCVLHQGNQPASTTEASYADSTVLNGWLHYKHTCMLYGL